MNDEHDKDLELDDYREDEQNIVILKTHENINRDLCGEIMRIEQGYVELRLTTSSEMVADDQGLIHGGFIFGAADFAAMAAVNEKNVVLVGSETHFLSPVKFGDEINFVARVRHKERQDTQVGQIRERDPPHLCDDRILGMFILKKTTTDKPIMGCIP